MKTKWLDRRIACSGPHLALCLSADEFHAAMAHINADDQSARWVRGGSATTHCVSDDSGKLTCIVCISDFDGRDPIEVAGLLVHEAVHVWQRYAASIGEDRPGDEQEAYAVQAISQELMAEFSRRMS